MLYVSMGGHVFQMGGLNFLVGGGGSPWGASVLMGGGGWKKIVGWGGAPTMANPAKEQLAFTKERFTHFKSL